MNNWKENIDEALISAVRAAEEQLAAAKQALRDHAIALSPYERGQTVRDRHSGARYEILDFDLSHNRGIGIYLKGRRIYKTGRSPARSTTFLYESQIEIVPADTGKEDAS